MFLRALELHQVRSIGHAEFSFASAEDDVRRWTLLVGENGCGKTTVLRALALVLAGSEALPELLGAPDSWVRNGAESCTIAATLATAEGERRDIALTLERGDSLREIFRRNETTLDALDRALRHASRNYLCVGYGANRRPQWSPFLPSDGLPIRHPRARGVATLFLPDFPLHPIELWAMDLQARQRAGDLEAVRRTLADLLPSVAFHGFDYDRGQLLFDTPDGVVPLRQLSDGYQSMAAWCGDLIYRLTEIYANYQRPLIGRGLLLIDEVDLHLHPAWQRALRQFLLDKLPQMQIVATSNSPLIADSSGSDEVYVGGDHTFSATSVVPAEFTCRTD